MKVNLYVIFDRVAGQYGEPFTAVKDSLAQRRFAYLMQNSPMVAADCELYKIGFFDNEVGVLTACEKTFICKFDIPVGGSN